MNVIAKVTARQSGGSSFSGGEMTFREQARLKKVKLYTFSDGDNFVTFKLLKGVLYLYEVGPVGQPI